MSDRRGAGPVPSRWLLVALLPALLALGCEEGARAGSVYRVRVPYGPWWVYPGVYDRPLALGRPAVVTPPPADPVETSAKDSTGDDGEATSDEE
jgi:hypothetical protein